MQRIMDAPYRAVGGSVIGSDHRRVWRNRQDAFAFAAQGERFAAVVCDGCGSQPASELGALVGAKLFSRLLLERMGRLEESSELGIRGACHALLEILACLVPSATTVAGEERLRFIEQHLLFTMVGFFDTGREAGLFALGDGCAWLNGERVFWGPYPDNAPPYLGYALMSASSDISGLLVLKTLPSAEVCHALIATDGFEPAAATASDFWEMRTSFHNPDSVRRRLFRLGGYPAASGVFSDDATVIAIRRKEELHV